MKNIMNISLVCFFWMCTISFGLAQTLNVATYNIRNANKGDAAQGDGWLQRAPVISTLIQFHEFDVFGIQEGFHHQVETLKNGLPGFDYVGVGRDDGHEKGEYAAVFYNTEKFKLLDHGDFWLSEDTERPNKGWDAALPRICTWAKLRIKASGKELFVFNVHFDHVGTKARSESAKLLLQKVKEMASNHSSIVMGDFNVDQFNESYALLNESKILEDAYVRSPIQYATTGTFNNFNPGSKTESRIDHIFLTTDFTVTRYGVLTDTYRSENKVEAYQSGNFPKEVSLKDYSARVPSDHFPVMISVQLPVN